VTARPRTAGWTLGLLAVTFVWGSTFVIVKEAVERLPVFPFNAWRFLLATLVLGAIMKDELRLLDRRGLFHGIVLGAALWGGYAFQTFGLRLTTAPKAAFITGMVVVITPLLQALVLRRPPSPAAAFGATLAAAGLALLTLEGSLVPGAGDLLVLACAVSFALHLVGLGAWSRQHPIGALATVQLATATVLHGLGGAAEHVATGGLAWAPPDAYVWTSIVFTAVFASAFAFFVQTGAQQVLSPTRVAVIFTMEPVFAWLTSWLGVPILLALGVTGLVPETFGLRDGFGAVVILVGMLWSELRTGEPADALAASETGVISRGRLRAPPTRRSRSR
jgi:drug/metabolite transporter (DMT)-like permease